MDAEKKVCGVDLRRRLGWREAKDDVTWVLCFQFDDVNGNHLRVRCAAAHLLIAQQVSVSVS